MTSNVLCRICTASDFLMMLCGNTNQVEKSFIRNLIFDLFFIKFKDEDLLCINCAVKIFNFYKYRDKVVWREHSVMDSTEDTPLECKENILTYIDNISIDYKITVKLVAIFLNNKKHKFQEYIQSKGLDKANPFNLKINVEECKRNISLPEPLNKACQTNFIECIDNLTQTDVIRSINRSSQYEIKKIKNKRCQTNNTDSNKHLKLVCNSSQTDTNQCSCNSLQTEGEDLNLTEAEITPCTFKKDNNSTHIASEPPHLEDKHVHYMENEKQSYIEKYVEDSIAYNNMPKRTNQGLEVTHNNIPDRTKKIVDGAVISDGMVKKRGRPPKNNLNSVKTGAVFNKKRNSRKNALKCNETLIPLQYKLEIDVTNTQVKPTAKKLVPINIFKDIECPRSNEISSETDTGYIGSDFSDIKSKSPSETSISPNLDPCKHTLKREPALNSLEIAENTTNTLILANSISDTTDKLSLLSSNLKIDNENSSLNPKATNSKRLRNSCKSSNMGPPNYSLNRKYARGIVLQKKISENSQRDNDPISTSPIASKISTTETVSNTEPSIKLSSENSDALQCNLFSETYNLLSTRLLTTEIVDNTESSIKLPSENLDPLQSNIFTESDSKNLLNTPVDTAGIKKQHLDLGINSSSTDVEMEFKKLAETISKTDKLFKNLPDTDLKGKNENISERPVYTESPVDKTSFLLSINLVSPSNPNSSLISPCMSHRSLLSPKLLPVKEKALFNCRACGVVLHDRAERKSHKKNHMQCKFCKRKFRSIKATNDHLETECLVLDIHNKVPRLILEKVENISELNEVYKNAMKRLNGESEIQLLKKNKTDDS